MDEVKYETLTNISGYEKYSFIYFIASKELYSLHPYQLVATGKNINFPNLNPVNLINGEDLRDLGKNIPGDNIQDWFIADKSIPADQIEQAYIV